MTHTTFELAEDLSTGTLERVEYDSATKALRLATPAPATFTRASTAYSRAGVLVASGVPRYELGRFHNTLTANHSQGRGLTLHLGTLDAETQGRPDPLGGTNAVRHELSGGTNTLKAYVSGATALPGESASIQVWVRRVGGAALTIGSNGFVTPSAVISDTDTAWRKVTGSGTTAILRGRQITFSAPTVADVLDFEIAFLQIEESTFISAWRLGGTGHALTVEESITNLLTANQSSIETDTTGMAAHVNCTIARSTVQVWSGSASLAGTATAAGDMSFGTGQGGSGSGTVAVTAGTLYTFQLKTRAGTTGRPTRLYVRWYDSAGAFISTDAATAFITNTTAWTSLAGAVTAPTGAAFAAVRFVVGDSVTMPAAGEVHYIDGLQVEARGYATSWQIGGTARAAEQSRTSGTGVVSQTAGAFECWFYLFNSAVPRSTSPRLISFRAALEQAASGMVLYVNTTDRISALYGTGAGGTITLAGSPIVVNTWYHAAVTWDADGGRLYQNGVLIGSSATVPAEWTAVDVTFGASSAGGAQLNGIIDDVRISSRARTAAEIAATYNSGAPAPIDADTTYKLSLDQTLAVEGRGGRRTSPAYDLSEVSRYTGSRLTYATEGPGTVTVEARLDGQEWAPISSGGSLAIPIGTSLVGRTLETRQTLVGVTGASGPRVAASS